MSENPTAFISYSWDDESHKEWVRDLARRLRIDGVETILDQWEIHLGDQTTAFMETAVRENRFVIIICTPHYKERSDNRVGGVGYEGDIMTAEVLNTGNRRKFIPVLRRGTSETAIPSWLSGSARVKLSGNPYSEEEYSTLVQTLLGTRDTAPPVGGIVSSSSASASSETFQEYILSAHARWAELVSDLPNDSPVRFPSGHYEMGFALTGASPVASLGDLEAGLRAARPGYNMGLEPFYQWDDIEAWRPYPIQSFVESWSGAPTRNATGEIVVCPDIAEFWRASLDGKLYTLRGYIEDTHLASQQQQEIEPGTVLDINMPIVNVARGLRFAGKFAESIEGVERIDIRYRFTGLNRRSLRTVFSSGPFPSIFSMGRTYECRTNEELSPESHVSLQEIRDDLPMLIHNLLKPFYEKFDFYELTLDRVEQQLQQYRLTGD